MSEFKFFSKTGSQALVLKFYFAQVFFKKLSQKMWDLRYEISNCINQENLVKKASKESEVNILTGETNSRFPVSPVASSETDL